MTHPHPIYQAYSYGWSVAPVLPGDKKAADKWKSYQTQRVALSGIRDWLTRLPNMNYAIITGALSGIIVCDVDGTEGMLSLAQLGIMPRTVYAGTPHGRHYFFKHPGRKVATRAPANDSYPGLDSRGDGGYVVGAGSQRSVGVYTWVNSPSDTPIADAPDWWLSLVTDPDDDGKGPHHSGLKLVPTNKQGDHTRYAQKAFDSEIDILRSIDKDGHSRNDQLNRSAFSLGTLVGAQLLDENTVYNTLYSTALAIGLDQNEIGPTIRSGMDAGRSHPRNTAPAHSPHLTNSYNGNGRLTDDGEIVEGEVNDVGELLRDAHLTDAGNADCMVALHNDDFRFDHSREKWLQWDGMRWEVDADGEADRVALEVIKKRQMAALDIEDKEKFSKTMAALKRAEDDPKRRALLRTAGIKHPYATTIEHYDQHDWLAATRVGTLDLRTGELRDARRTDLLTMLLGCAYDLAALCPRWLAFLGEVFAGNVELIDYIQRAVGYSLTGDTTEQKLFLLYGSGANGKSVFLETLSSLFGDYAGNSPFDTFDANKRSEMTNDLAALKGKRFVTVIETDEDKRLAEARIKAVTGQDQITCRFLRQEFFSYKPTWKLWMAMNHKPIIRGNDRGIWRRLKLIPFLESFEGKEDRYLGEKLRAELPGILNWALEGLAVWRTEGLGEAQIVEEATEAYRRESDLVGQWLEENIEEQDTSFLASVDGYRSYRYWCKTWGHRDMSATTWGRSMTDRGHKAGTVRKNPVTKKAEKGYPGLHLLTVVPVEEYESY